MDCLLKNEYCLAYPNIFFGAWKKCFGPDLTSIIRFFFIEMQVHAVLYLVSTTQQITRQWKPNKLI